MSYEHPLSENRTSMPVAKTPRRILYSVLAVFSVVAAALPTLEARAQAVYEVEVGRFFDDSDHTRESMRFLPGVMRVHQGDVVRFVTGGFHSVSLLPAGQDVDEWVAGNAGGLGRNWSVFVPDPDEGATAIKANLRVLQPSHACGWPGQEACEYFGDGSGVEDVLHSGVALFPSPNGGTETKQLSFSVAVQADPGTQVDVLDLLHPAMRMRIEVVEADEAASDPGELAAEADRLVAADAATARRLHKKYVSLRTQKTFGGKKHWMAWAGVETPTVALRRMYPSTLTVKKGDRVRWSFTENVFAAHTVTFPATRGRALGNAFPQIACDPDGDVVADEETAALPDEAPSSTVAPYCEDPTQLELDLPDGIALPAGNGAVSGPKDFESSGVRGAGLAESADAYSLRFTRTSPKQGFRYLDVIHEIAHAPMSGRVIVRARK